jgi:hypothetical protein
MATSILKEQTMKTKFLGIIAIAIIGIAIIGCKEDEPEPQPQPVAQSKTITIAEGKTVTVNYTALPGTTPAWWNTLEQALRNMMAGFSNGNYTLNVTPNGTDGFIAGASGSKSATVSNAWLSKSDYNAMRISISGIQDDWVL